MEYAIVKISGESDIMGRVAMLDNDYIQLENPVYIQIRPSRSGSLSVGMQRATMFAGEGDHILLLDLTKVLSYYKPSDGMIDYYNDAIQTYMEYHDSAMEEQLAATEEAEDSEEFVKSLREFLNIKNANTAYH